MEENLWKQAKKRIIGGSEVGSILGVNPYQSAYALWIRKTERSPPIKENKYMRAGKRLEPVIVQMWQDETGYEIQEGSEENSLYYHPEYPFIAGTPDRLYTIPTKGITAVTGVLECKNTRLNIDVDNFPKHWWCQLQYYMGLTKKEQGEIAWLYQGVDLFHLSFDFSPQFYDYMVKEVVHFWHEFIENDIPPPANGIDLDHQFPHHIIGNSVIAVDSTMKLVAKIHEIRNKKRELDHEETLAIDQIKNIMRDNEALVSPANEILATWKTNKRNKRVFLFK